MLRKIVWGLLIILLIGMVGTVRLMKTSISTSDEDEYNIIVPDDYPTIQEAIDVALGGYRIFVRANNYNETITIDKSLSLIGENRDSTIIDGSEFVDIGKIIDIKADVSNVNIAGFLIQNPRADPHWGICVGWRTSNINISGNKIRYCDHGIWISNCSNSIITNNEFEGNLDGVHVDSWSYNIEISDNTISGLRPPQYGTGIYIWGARRIDVINNSLTQIGAGIALWECNSINVTDNLMDESTWVGIRLEPGGSSYHCANNTFSYNIIRSEYYGIELYGTENRIENNTFSSNSIWGSQVGILIYFGWAPPYGYVRNNVVVGNEIQYCDFGIKAETNTSGNYIYHNSLINNAVQATDEGDNFWNKAYPCGGNYWSDYEDYDLYWGDKQNVIGSDMIGDTPYEISTGKNDDYPLMKAPSTSPKFQTYRSDSIAVFTDSLITSFSFDQTQNGGEINFIIETDIFDSYKMIIPKRLLDGAFNLLIDGIPTACTIMWSPNHHILNFTYSQGSHDIKIMAEYAMSCPEDVHRDGQINIIDLSKVAIKFGQTCP